MREAGAGAHELVNRCELGGRKPWEGQEPRSGTSEGRSD